MANNWFQFKKFMVRQDRTAMKVGTDGVLLGAWADVERCERILDVGTGTGLIALMVAQRCEAYIDAIEIDVAAAKQAAENIDASHWASRMCVKNISFQDYCDTTRLQYDHVVCNPPFFSNSMKATGMSRSIARHSDPLELSELVAGTVKILKTEGKLSVILPSVKELEMTKLSGDHLLFPSRILRIRPLPGKDFKRVLMEFTLNSEKASESEMSIETSARHHYSEEYLALTSEYYLDGI